MRIIGRFGNNSPALFENFNDEERKAEIMNEKVALTKAQSTTLALIDQESHQGEEWGSTDAIDKRVLNNLEREAYITLDLAKKQVRITAAGKIALGNHVVIGTAEHVKLLRQAAQDGENRLSIEIPSPSPKPAPYKTVMRNSNGSAAHPDLAGPAAEINVPEVTQTVIQQLKEAKEVAGQTNDCSGCASCVHRDVVEMLRVKYPKIDELVEALSKARAIRDELGI